MPPLSRPSIHGHPYLHLQVLELPFDSEKIFRPYGLRLAKRLATYLASVSGIYNTSDQCNS
jgi:hypothetical protein